MPPLFLPSPPLRRFCLVLAGTISFLLFYLGAQPFAAGLIPSPWDSLAHFSVFGAITGLVWIGTGGWHPWALAALVSSVGAVDEWRQLYLPGRTADPMDWAADTAAAICAILLFEYLKARQPKAANSTGEQSCVESSAPSP